MLNSIKTFSFLFGYFPVAAVKLKNFRKKKPHLTVEEYDALIHAEPRKWVAGIMKHSKSEVSVTGLEPVPEGSVFIISNHESNFDIPVILSSIPKPFGFIRSYSFSQK